MAAVGEQGSRELMPDHERAEVMLSGDVPVRGERDIPSSLDAAARRDVPVEVLAGRAQPTDVNIAGDAVRLLTGEERDADVAAGRCQARRGIERDHHPQRYWPTRQLSKLLPVD